MASAVKIRSVRILLNVEPKDLKQQKLCAQTMEGTQTIVRLTLVINRWKKKKTYVSDILLLRECRS